MNKFSQFNHFLNIRLSYTIDPETNVLKILEENHYYPFGLKHTNYNTYKRKFTKEEEPVDPPPGTLGNDYKIRQVLSGEMVAYKYKYNGKEWQDELELNFYDYGARNYDPAIGRWMNIDPLAEKSRRWSSYTYCYNNPLVFVDYDGMYATPPTDLFNIDGKKIGTDGVNNGDKMVVTDKAEANQIANTKGNIDLSTVKSGEVLPSDAALSESLNVLERTVNNGGKKEESSLVMNDGTIVQGKQGTEAEYGKDEIAGASLPNVPTGKTDADVEVSIHSHPTKAEVIGDKVYAGDATVPGPKDPSTFARFGTNIIVGPLGQASGRYQTNNITGLQSIVPSTKPNGISIYKGSTTTPLNLTKKAVERILNK
jgi:RHS repeat-associated protein